MDENKGIIKSIIKGYNDSKLAIVKKFTDSGGDSLEENDFLDDGYISTKISCLKKRYQKNEGELQLALEYEKKSDEWTKEKIARLINEQRSIRMNIAFMASNSFDGAKKSLNLIDDIDSDFKQCLEALILYHSGQEDASLIKFHDFLKNEKEPIDHFLINKIFGKLLCAKRQYRQAIPILQKAVEKRPEDVELHTMLIECYDRCGMSFEKLLEGSIVELFQSNKP